ncbi:hypothetical protein CHLNCDRAFT_137935 [Chlorella variabilis]|uniref:Protein kinase domain-containing protein n=1 Tax=Chlorella variabilis TaxID=554065 RepID=E1Z4V9_CHLVA|nr:hypothetical protein CHLNCDRAFT_137935 [Chlorella variabilis]EFN59416.1 hypothetical protein CHLNCDRAFT_137935 [Chlorella variabilis]|eukprot:XP_005851518.1 hypothetical protein CHLNCDRAFT_137935 [Chlorella variabilis]
MGCAPSKQEAQANGGADAAAATHHKLNKKLSEKARHPSAIPASFFEREHRFRREQRPSKAVAERRQGPCRHARVWWMRTGTWGAWSDGWCELAGHTLQFYGGAGEAPGPGVAPQCKWELVGAHLRMERKQELGLTPAGGGAVVSLGMPDEQQAQEWMVGLAAVPGLFRRVPDYYELGAAWGHGATCTVCECVGRYNGQRYALKSRLHKSRGATEAMHNELRILQICAKKPHPAIPRLHDYFFDEDGSIELVMDLMEGGELFDHIATSPQLREHDARAIFRQVAEGVAHLHALGIAHRDLKPQNLMYVSADEGAQVKIMDYDLARVNYAPDWEGATPCGTIHYMAPEIVQHRRYSLAVDMWSLGVILFILLTGRMPFDGKNQEAIAEAIEAGRYCMDPQLWSGVSEDAKDLVRSLLQQDPQQRLTAEQVLQHPWLSAELDPMHSAELKTERGRELLALAALAYSEGDLRQAGGAAGGGGGAPAPSPRLPKMRARLSAGRAPVAAAGQALDFDMQAVRDQAGGGARANGKPAGAQPGLRSTAEGAEQDEDEDEAVTRLRSQLRIIGTAAGLQDRSYLELAGRQLPPGSPRIEDRAPLAAQRPTAARQWQPAVDGFGDLGGQEVVEERLSGCDSDSDSGSEEAGLSGPGGGRSATAGRQAAQWAAGGAPIQLPRLPPVHSLPADQQLLQQLSRGGRGGAEAGQGGLKRAQSAYAVAGGGGGGMPRATSTSQLDGKDARIPASQREPVERAMQQKQRWLARLRTASPTAHEWQRMTAAAPPPPCI